MEGQPNSHYYNDDPLSFCALYSGVDEHYKRTNERVTSKANDTISMGAVSRIPDGFGSSTCSGVVSATCNICITPHICRAGDLLT